MFVGGVLEIPAWSLESSPSDKGLILVEGGILRPFYPASDDDKEIKVQSFRIDEKPVTNVQYLDFVRKNTQWRRDKVKKLFVDSYYLRHWKTPSQLNPGQENQPVTFVSWFAAKAYCESQGKRLPSEYEWEYAAQANATKKDASQDLKWRQELLNVYSKPAAKVIPNVKQDSPNAFGLFDLHTLVWEWVQDFNGSLLRVDSRDGKDVDKMKFCGASALDANEKEDYPSFIRMAYRSSLKASYSAEYLGFRCAQ